MAPPHARVELKSPTLGRVNPFAIFYTGDVNGHTQSWFPEGNTNLEGTKLDECFSNLNLYQMINEPTHFFRDDCIPSCIDIILTNQPNLVLNSGVRPSLDPAVKHQLFFVNLTSKFHPLLTLSESYGILTVLMQMQLKKLSENFHGNVN